MTSELTYLIAQQRIAELQHAAAQRQLAREASPRRPRTTSPRRITRVAARLAAIASVI